MELIIYFIPDVYIACYMHMLPYLDANPCLWSLLGHPVL